jgi:hypothetical protein
MTALANHLVLAATTTTTFDAHRGAALPAARVVIIAVPTLALVLFWLLVVRPKRKG